jgi:hypothetical protein
MVCVVSAPLSFWGGEIPDTTPTLPAKVNKRWDVIADMSELNLFDFHEVRQMIDAFNKHYESEYSPSWLSCIDELMNVRLNKFCPGFMSLPRKPHSFGNEYHSIADGD